MARLGGLCFSLALLLLFADLPLSSSLDEPASPPQREDDSSSPLPSAPSSEPSAPIPSSPSDSSPPAPPPSDSSPSPSVSGSLAVKTDEGGANGDDSKGYGWKGGKKVRIAVGIIVGAGFIRLGGFVYKKRQENARRRQFGYAVGAIVGAGIVGLGGFVYQKRQENVRRSQYS